MMVCLAIDCRLRCKPTIPFCTRHLAELNPDDYNAVTAGRGRWTAAVRIRRQAAAVRIERQKR